MPCRSNTAIHLCSRGVWQDISATRGGVWTPRVRAESGTTLRFRGRGRDGKGSSGEWQGISASSGGGGTARRRAGASQDEDKRCLAELSGACRCPPPSPANLPHAHPGARCGVELRRWSRRCIDEECEKGDTCKIEAPLDQCPADKGKEAARHVKPPQLAKV